MGDKEIWISKNNDWKRAKKNFNSLNELYETAYENAYICIFLLLLATIGDIYGPILVKVFIDDYLTPKEFPYQPLVNLALLYIFIQVFKVGCFLFSII